MRTALNRLKVEDLLYSTTVFIIALIVAVDLPVRYPDDGVDRVVGKGAEGPAAPPTMKRVFDDDAPWRRDALPLHQLDT